MRKKYVTKAKVRVVYIFTHNNDKRGLFYDNYDSDCFDSNTTSDKFLNKMHGVFFYRTYNVVRRRGKQYDVRAA